LGKVYLVGDYDESKLYETASAEYRNISLELTEEYNRFIGLETRKLVPER
jgi:hypothetical protein